MALNMDSGSYLIFLAASSFLNVSSSEIDGDTIGNVLRWRTEQARQKLDTPPNHSLLHLPLQGEYCSLGLPTLKNGVDVSWKSCLKVIRYGSEGQPSPFKSKFERALLSFLYIFC